MQNPRPSVRGYLNTSQHLHNDPSSSVHPSIASGRGLKSYNSPMNVVRLQHYTIASGSNRL